MSRRKIFGVLSGVVVAVLTATLVLPLSAAPPSTTGDPIPNAPGNLLTNPGFEAPYVKQCCHTEPNFPSNLPVDEVQVPLGWHGWWREPDSGPEYPARCDREGTLPGCVAFHRPEWRDAAAGGGAFPYRIRTGQNAQKYFTFYSIHEAGMYQQVTGVKPGQRVRFSVYLMAWATTESGNPTSSGQQTMNLKVGIDPTGGVNPFSSNIVWSPPGDSYDVYSQFAIEAVAQSATVTVFTYSKPVYPLIHNDVYVDDAALVVVGAGAVTGARPSAASGSAVPATGPYPGTTTDKDGNILYVVQSGDTTWSLSRRFNTTVNAIVQWNNLKSANILRLGKTIIVGKIKK